MSASEAGIVSAERGPSAFLVTALGKLVGQSARYLVASAVALAADVAVYVGLMRSGLIPPVAGIVGYSAGLLVHYVLSARWVFADGGRRRTVPTLFKFAASGLLGLAITALIIDGITRGGIADAFVAKGIAVATSYVTVFVLRRFYVFAGVPRS